MTESFQMSASILLSDIWTFNNLIGVQSTGILWILV